MDLTSVSLRLTNIAHKVFFEARTIRMLISLKVLCKSHVLFNPATGGSICFKTTPKISVLLTLLQPKNYYRSHRSWCLLPVLKSLSHSEKFFRVLLNARGNTVFS